MKRDNRIYRAELLTEKEKEAFGNGISAYLAAEREREEEKAKAWEKEKAEKLATGEYIEKDGKLYAAKYFKG